MSIVRQWKAEQREWAVQRGHSIDHNGYVIELRANLYQVMSVETRADFGAGAGCELLSRREGGMPKIHALHSSSALVCNVFDYWRSRGLEPLAKALGCSSPIEGISFEAQFPTGLRGTAPNLDVALWLSSAELWAIESKFTEPLGTHDRSEGFRSAYFPGGRPIWSERGLARCGELADSMQNQEVTFRYLDAAQLMKHALGLQQACPGQFTLVYLYADGDAPENLEHRSEIGRFSSGIEGDFPFVAFSYKELFTKLSASVGSEHRSYLEYLAARYRFLAPDPRAVE